MSTYKISSAITLNGHNNVILSGLAVPSIMLTNCTNITVEGCKIGSGSTVGIETYQCKDIKIINNLISGVTTGIYAINSQNIVVDGNQAKNIQGPYPRGQFVQFNGVSGLSQITNNKVENILGQSGSEDVINVYKSHGSANNPIMVSGNTIRGGGPANSGGGIMLGDNGGSYITATNNVLVDPGQYGMAIAGGIHMTITNNKIYGKQQSFTNVGLYYWNQSGLMSSAITMSGNHVNFTNKSGALNNFWIGGGDAKPNGWTTNIADSTLNESLLATPLVSF